MTPKLYIQTDDRLKIGDKALPHTNFEGKAFHDKIMKNKKEFLKQFTEKCVKISTDRMEHNDKKSD